MQNASEREIERAFISLFTFHISMIHNTTTRHYNRNFLQALTETFNKHSSEYLP